MVPSVSYAHRHTGRRLWRCLLSNLTDDRNRKLSNGRSRRSLGYQDYGPVTEPRTTIVRKYKLEIRIKLVYRYSMLCKSCGETQTEFTVEMCVHLPGCENLNQPPIFIFPKVSICQRCGAADFVVADTELELLKPHFIKAS